MIDPTDSWRLPGLPRLLFRSKALAAFGLALALGFSGRCQVFDEIHYVYVPLDVSEDRSVVKRSSPPSPGAGLNPRENGATSEDEKESSPPRVLTDGQGRSIRFYLESVDVSEAAAQPSDYSLDSGDSGKSPEPEKPGVQLYITAMNPDMARGLYRRSRNAEQAGRMPDLFFLEMRIVNNGRSKIRFDPYETRIRCGTYQSEVLSPEAYMEHYEGLSHFWLSYGWHMTPRPVEFFFREDPAEPALVDEYLLSRKESQLLRSRKLRFVRSLTRFATLEIGQSYVVLLPFEQLPLEQDCYLETPGIGPLNRHRFSFRIQRMDSEEKDKWLESESSPAAPSASEGTEKVREAPTAPT